MSLTVCEIKLDKAFYFANRFHYSLLQVHLNALFLQTCMPYSKWNVGIALNLVCKQIF